MNFADLPITSCGLAECLAKGKELISWEMRGKSGSGAGTKKQGIGMACSIHGTGPSFALPSYSAASIRINADGTAQLSVGTADLGTGSNTTLAQIAAEELGISLEAIDVISGDTSITAFDEGAFASMSLYSGGNAVRAAAADVKMCIQDCFGQAAGFDEMFKYFFCPLIFPEFIIGPAHGIFGGAGPAVFREKIDKSFIFRR